MTLVRGILHSERYNLLEARTGSQGIQIAENQDVDVILLDVELPDINGYEVALRLRNSEKTKLSRVPIIAVTAHAANGDAIKVFGAGCDYFISEPINGSELLEKVEMYMNDKVNVRN
jgi:CheY-like chemotaxis protein